MQEEDSISDVCRVAGPAACELISMAAVKSERKGRDVDDNEVVVEADEKKKKPELEPLGLLKKKLNNER